MEYVQKECKALAEASKAVDMITAKFDYWLRLESVKEFIPKYIMAEFSIKAIKLVNSGLA